MIKNGGEFSPIFILRNNYQYDNKNKFKTNYKKST